jgi:hypothetical protein
MPCQRTQDGLPTGGVHSVQNRSGRQPELRRRGRPERANRTPVNMGNQPLRDNGEGVASRPLPYPLRESKNERSE